MPITVDGKNSMLAALKGTNPSVSITHAGLLQEAAPVASVTGVAATNLLHKVAHGFTTDDMVVLRTLSGGAGLKYPEFPYWVIASGLGADDFKLSSSKGGSAFDFTTDIVSVSVVKLTELSGGSPAYARQAIAFAAPAEGILDDSTNGAIFDVPASSTVNQAGFFSAGTSGTCLATKQLTTESFTGQGTYTLTDCKLDLNSDTLP